MNTCRLAVLACFAPAMLLAVDGVVINQTTGKPQSGATVTLIRLGQSMETAGTAQTNEAGKFTLPGELQAASPHLLQVAHAGVTYNTTLAPGSGSTGIQLSVYDSADRVPEAKVTRHLIALQPSADELAVNEILVFTNTGKLTLNPESGGIRIYVPAAVKSPVRVSVQGPSGMPLQRPAEKTNEANVFTVKYPIRPGETRVDYNYTMPLSAAPQYRSKALHDGPVQLLTPKGVSIEGEGASRLGEDPRIPGTLYQINSREMAFAVSGQGTFREPGQESAAGGAEGGGAPAADDQPGIEQVKPRLYKRLGPVLALTLGMLAIGFALLYRSDSPRTSKRA